MSKIKIILITEGKLKWYDEPETEENQKNFLNNQKNLELVPKSKIRKNECKF